MTTLLPDARSDRVDVDGIGFDAVDERQVVSAVLAGLDGGRGGIVLTPNVDILRTLRQPDRRDLADSASLVVADGAPIVWASRLRGHPLPARVAGSELVHSLTDAAARHGRSVYLLGGEEGVAARGAEELRRRHPGLRVAGWHCPPHGFERDADLSQAVLDAVVPTAPDVVLVGLGFPKQDRLAQQLTEHLPETWFLGCGAGLSFLAGEVSRAPRWMQRSGLEWVYRLLQEPRRLGRRYLLEDIPYAAVLLGRAYGHRLRRR